MWNRIVKWHDDWEQEQLDVLADPSLVNNVPPGWRRACVQKLAALSPVERHELREFSMTYRGRRLWTALAKLVSSFTVAGVLAHFVWPAKLSVFSGIVAANALGFLLLMTLVSVWFNYRRMQGRTVRIFVRIVLLAIAGAAVGVSQAYFVGDQTPETLREKLPHILATVGIGAGIFIAIPTFIIGAIRNRHFEALTLQLQRDAERDRLARELSESQLRLLRAQIEPHFLFNTLGAVQQLAEHGAPKAAELTASLIAFLRASLTDMRSEQVTLGAEFRLVEAYLAIMQARLGGRLRYSVSLPEALVGARVPSMILLTLAENAIKHGIEPALRGGEVEVSAHASGEAIVLRVRDTGAGMSAVPGAGVGLENVRRRLQLAHGSAASLTVEDHGDGVLAEIVLPAEVNERVA
jgi:signal transduction histidine kinase